MNSLRIAAMVTAAGLVFPTLTVCPARAGR